MFSFFKAVFINVSLAFWLCLGVFLCLEAWFRHKEGNNKPRVVYELTDDVHRPRPYVMAAAKPGFGFNGDIHNVLGYRNFPSPRKDGKEYRIVVIGGSTVHGGIKSLPDHVEERLRSAGVDNARVYNAGVGSSVSRQDMIRIMTDISGYAPDLIVHYGGGNDFILGADPRINYPHRFMFYENNALFAQNVKDYDWFLAFAMGSEFLRHYIGPYLQKRLQERIEFRLPPGDQVEELRARAYLENLVWGELLAQNVGARFLAVLQPLLPYKDHRSPEERRFSRNKSPVRLRKLFLAEYEREGSPFNFVDCSHVFKNETAHVYTDHIHLRESFRHRPAKCVVEAILSRPELLRPRNFKSFDFTPEERFLKGF